MAVQMARPTKHPKSGTYRVRLMIPPVLRDTAHTLFGVRTELVESLRTKDAREASRLGPAASVRLNVRLDAIRQEHAGAGRDPTDRDVAALTGDAYRWRVAAQGDHAGTPAEWRLNLDLLSEQRTPTNAEGDFEVDPNKRDRSEAAEMLQEGGWAPHPESVARVAVGVTTARTLFAQTMLRRSRGDWSPDEYLSQFPTPSPSPQHASPTSAITFDALLSGWAKDHGHSLDVKPISRAAYDRKRTLIRLGEFLGHTDALKVAKADVVRWKEDMQGRGLAVATIRNDISEVSAIWRWAISNGKLETNPFQGVSPPKEKRRRNPRRAFTPDEATTILTDSRTQKGFLRWLPWVCCLTGARISEICQASKADVVVLDSIHVLRIHDDGDTDSPGFRSLKNSDSRRTIPLHPALIAEGFLKYVEKLPAGSLFPDARPDCLFGNVRPTRGRSCPDG